MLGHTITTASVRLAFLLLLSHSAQAFSHQLEARLVSCLTLPGVVRGGDLGRVYKEVAVVDPVVASLQVVLIWAADSDWDTDLGVDTLKDLGTLVNDGLHLQKAGSSEETDNILELQGHVTGVAERKELLEHLGAFDDRDGKAAHGAES